MRQLAQHLDCLIGERPSICSRSPQEASCFGMEDGIVRKTANASRVHHGRITLQQRVAPMLGGSLILLSIGYGSRIRTY